MKRKSKALSFSCGHVFEEEDPWSYVSNSGILDAETRLLILEHIYKEPKTVTQLANELGLSQPAVHRHVRDMLHVGIIREAALSEDEKRFRVEKYYEPNFPVVLKEDFGMLKKELEEVSEKIVRIFLQEKDQIKKEFEKTALKNQGWAFNELTFYVFEKVKRMVRNKLQEGKFFPEKEWIFFAEESPDSE
ncbi:MAG: winged helix-turn-helix transcriptional regulator [Theionarchaea archaeon]|nr:winged helix-turn-helix transcriptional regulator [Theionarchaea archaeon]